MMRPCSQCLENHWVFEFIDGFVRATCQICSYEVEFEAKRDHNRITGDTPCRKCGGKLEYRERKPNKPILPSGIYFLYWWKCQKCSTTFMAGEAKRQGEPNTKVSSEQLDLQLSELRNMV